MAEGRVHGTQDIDGLYVVAKTNAWKTVSYESVEGRRWRNGDWIEECREDGGCEKCVEGE